MKITRRTVLRLTGAAAASLALSSCSASGSAILGSNFSSWIQQTLASVFRRSFFCCILGGHGCFLAGSSRAARCQCCRTAAYDADPLTGEASAAMAVSWA